MYNTELVVVPLSLKPPLGLERYDSGVFIIGEVAYKAPEEAINDDRLLREGLSLEEKINLAEAEKSAAEILDIFCTLYNFPKTNFPTLLSTGMRKDTVGHYVLDGSFRYIQLNINLVKNFTKEDIVKVIVHETLHYLSKSVEKRSLNTKSYSRFSQTGLRYSISRDSHPWKYLGSNLNEAIVDTISQIISPKGYIEYTKIIYGSGYPNLVKPILRLMKYLEKIEPGSAKEFFDTMVEAFRDGKPYLIVRFLKDKINITFTAKKLLDADFGSILNPKPIKLQDLQVIDHIQIDKTKQPICFKSDNLTMRFVGRSVIIDGKNEQCIASISFDDQNNPSKVRVNDHDALEMVLSKETNFPLADYLQQEVEKTELPYFNHNFWKKSPKST